MRTWSGSATSMAIVSRSSSATVSPLRVDQRQRRPGAAPGQRARERLGREEVRGGDVGGEVAADGGGERQIVDADEPPLEHVRLGQRRRQRALAPVEKQPVAGPQHPEELAEDPRALGVDLQRALPIGHARPRARSGSRGRSPPGRGRRRRWRGRGRAARPTTARSAGRGGCERPGRTPAARPPRRPPDGARTRRGMCANSSHDACRVAGGSVGLGPYRSCLGRRRAQPSTGLREIRPGRRACSAELALRRAFPLCAGGACGSDRACSSRWRWWRCRSRPRAAGTSRRRPRRPSSGSPTAVQAGDGGGAVRRARSADALGSDDHPEVPPRGLRHRAQQLSRRARARPGEAALRARRHRARRRASSSAPTTAPGLLPTLVAAGAGDAAHRGRARPTARPTAVLDAGAARAAGARRERRLGLRRASPSGPRTTRTAPTTISRSCARAPPTTSGPPHARRNDPQAASRRETPSSSRCSARPVAASAAPAPPSRRLQPAAPAGPRRTPRRSRRRASTRSPRSCARRALTLESRFADVRVEGEISGLKRSGPGHLYFCLKDDEAPARLRAVLARGGAAEVHASKRGWRSAAAGG